ncbi:MAG: HD domain-containing phosphohydrolase [Actinomycetota bacterium]
MPGRPSKRVIALELAALAAALVVAVLCNGDSNWDLGLFAILLATSVIGDLTAVDTPASRMAISSSFLTIVTATVFLGETPAAVIGVATIGAGWLRFRYAPTTLLINLVTYAWFPLISGLAFAAALQGAGVGQMDALFYVFVFGLFVVALAIDFILIAGYFSYVEGTTFWAKVRRALAPLLPSELASALLAVGVAYLYVQLGLPTVALFAIVVIVFQYLIGALLLSQQRADELEVRAKQLAGFQVALLSALLRTLDLRDRMTARHSAAVARYAREIAAAAGLSEEEQELAHTAGLLHDIGKFILPDRILKGNVELTEADWVEIRKHPYEGARIVSQIDGYQPVGEIILAHHERLDGLGYPLSLRGEEIPLLSKVIAVADTYDVLTARDSYRRPVSTYEAITELRRSAGTQLDPALVEILAELLVDKDLPYRHGEDADFETELALDRRIHEYATAGTTPGPRLPI